MAQIPPDPGSLQPEARRLFQSHTLTAIFGRSVATLLMRSVFILVVASLPAILVGGLLIPGAASTGKFASHAPVGIQVGDAAPNFTLTTLDGKQMSLSDYRGRPVILNFWYAACPGCLAEIPGLQHFYATQQAAGKDLVILGINAVDDFPTAQQFVQQFGVTYPNVLDDNQRVATLYNLTATPTSYFIDRHGIIHLVVRGPVDDAALQQGVAEISQA
jgi:peroxiredoxin